jgi:hypothetical protein
MAVIRRKIKGKKKQTNSNQKWLNYKYWLQNDKIKKIEILLNYCFKPIT